MKNSLVIKLPNEEEVTEYEQFVELDLQSSAPISSSLSISPIFKPNNQNRNFLANNNNIYFKYILLEYISTQQNTLNSLLSLYKQSTSNKSEKSTLSNAIKKYFFNIKSKINSRLSFNSSSRATSSSTEFSSKRQTSSSSTFFSSFSFISSKNYFLKDNIDKNSTNLPPELFINEDEVGLILKNPFPSLHCRTFIINNQSLLQSPWNNFVYSDKSEENNKDDIDNLTMTSKSVNINTPNINTSILNNKNSIVTVLKLFECNKKYIKLNKYCNKKNNFISSSTTLTPMPSPPSSASSINNHNYLSLINDINTNLSYLIHSPISPLASFKLSAYKIPNNNENNQNSTDENPFEPPISSSVSTKSLSIRPLSRSISKSIIKSKSKSKISLNITPEECYSPFTYNREEDKENISYRSANNLGSYSHQSSKNSIIDSSPSNLSNKIKNSNSQSNSYNNNNYIDSNVINTNIKRGRKRSSSHINTSNNCYLTPNRVSISIRNQKRIKNPESKNNINNPSTKSRPRSQTISSTNSNRISSRVGIPSGMNSYTNSPIENPRVLSPQVSIPSTIISELNNLEQSLIVKSDQFIVYLSIPKFKFENIEGKVKVLYLVQVQVESCLSQNYYNYPSSNKEQQNVSSNNDTNHENNSSNENTPPPQLHPVLTLFSWLSFSYIQSLSLTCLGKNALPIHSFINTHPIYPLTLPIATYEENLSSSSSKKKKKDSLNNVSTSIKSSSSTSINTYLLSNLNFPKKSILLMQSLLRKQVWHEKIKYKKKIIKKLLTTSNNLNYKVIDKKINLNNFNNLNSSSLPSSPFPFSFSSNSSSSNSFSSSSKTISTSISSGSSFFTTTPKFETLNHTSKNMKFNIEYVNKSEDNQQYYSLNSIELNSYEHFQLPHTIKQELIIIDHFLSIFLTHCSSFQSLIIALQLNYDNETNYLNL